MATTIQAPPPTGKTLADWLHQLGDIPPHRVRCPPALGTASEADLLAVHAQEKRLYELVDGVLVEKGMAYRESCLALALAGHVRGFVLPRKLGLVSGEAGMLRLFRGLVRIPDVAFASWDRLPQRRMPVEPIPSLVPDLAAEVLSESNTPTEMERKREEYFRAGVRLVWIIDPDQRTVTVFTPDQPPVTLTAAQTLDGGAVLPGFALPLRELFAELDLAGNGAGQP